MMIPCLSAGLMLRSLYCAQYYDARSYSEKCFCILEEFLHKDPVVDGLHTHTEAMVAELDNIWTVYVPLIDPEITGANMSSMSLEGKLTPHT